MALNKIPILRWLLVAYNTNPDERAFLERAQNQSADDIEVTVAVLDAAESQRFFGVPMARRGIQPVWLRIVNRSRSPYRLNLLGDRSQLLFRARGRRGQSHFDRQAPVAIRLARLCVLAIPVVAADSIDLRALRQSENGRLLFAACVPSATGAARRRSRGFRVHAAGRRQQNCPRPVAGD